MPRAPSLGLGGPQFSELCKGRACWALPMLQGRGRVGPHPGTCPPYLGAMAPPQAEAKAGRAPGPSAAPCLYPPPCSKAVAPRTLAQ